MQVSNKFYKKFIFIIKIMKILVFFFNFFIIASNIFGFQIFKFFYKISLLKTIIRCVLLSQKIKYFFLTNLSFSLNL